MNTKQPVEPNKPTLASLAANINNYVAPTIVIENENTTKLNTDNHDDDDDDNDDETQIDAVDLTKNILPDFLEVDIEDLIFYDRCGNGAYGCVYRSHWISRDKEVAVKKLLQLDNEANVLSKLSHRNIIRFYGVVSRPPNFCLITEYAPRGSLQAFIHNHKLHAEYGLDLILQWAKDIALGMNYLHEEAPVKIIHRDLKSTNVVISEDMVCKICDFGTSTFSIKTTKMSLIGTFPWMSPEIIQGKVVNKKCDIWSYGVVLWELITGQLPFKGLESFQIAYLVIEREERLPIPNGCPQILSELMKYCWLTDPRARPSFRDILDTLDQCCINKTKAEINTQIETHKAKWETEIEIVFEKLKKIEQDLWKKEKILEERERKLREQEINLIKNFKIITIEDYDVNSWREIDVYEWIKKICEDQKIDAIIADVFLGNNINGRALLNLSKEDLKIMGISSIGHGLSLYQEIQHLRKENTRLLNFPPLRHAPSVSNQSSTKDYTFTACISAHIIIGHNPEEHKWKMVFEIDDTDDNKDINPILYIRDVKFVSRYPPFQQFNITKPPFMMQKWVKGISQHSKIDCIITFEEKVLKPRNTKIEFLLNPENNTSLIQEITITLENNSSDSISSTASTQSLTSVLLNSHHSSFSSPSTNDNFWKNRVFEHSAETTETKKDCSDLWAGVVTGKYKSDNNDHDVVYRPQKSTNVLLKTETQKSNPGNNINNSNDLKYKRRNTFNDYSRFDRTFSNNKNNNNNNNNDYKFGDNTNNTSLTVKNGIKYNSRKSVDNSKSGVVFDLNDSDTNSNTGSTSSRSNNYDENNNRPRKKQDYNNKNHKNYREQK